jgi:hypothetical protein
LVVAACGGGSDEGANTVETTVPATTVSATGGSETTVTTLSGAGEDGSPFGGLILEESYLRGTWCSQGTDFVVDDDGVTVGPLDPQPIEVYFGANPATSLVSSSQDEFVAKQAGQEVTFVRGSC